MTSNRVRDALIYARHALQQIKHAGFLALKWARISSRPLRTRVVDSVLFARGRTRKFVFDANNYPGSFVQLSPPEDTQDTMPVPRTLTMFWLGEAQMSPNRVRGLESVRRFNPNLKVRLLSLDDFRELLIDGEPLHPAFGNLALTHQSDYLRCYLMHFYGGGYVDVKPLEQSWEPALERLRSNSEAWALGYRELHHNTTTSLEGEVQDDCRRNFFRLIGNGGFIMRPRTPLTAEWYREMTRRVDFYASELHKHPGGVRGGEEGGGYPVPKHALLGDILAPLGLKYHDRLIIDDSIQPKFRDYI